MCMIIFPLRGNQTIYNLDVLCGPPVCLIQVFPPFPCKQPIPDAIVTKPINNTESVMTVGKK